MPKFAFIAILLALVARPCAAETPSPTFAPPHTEELAPGVFAAGFSHRYDDANCGWVVMSERTLLIDLPRGLDIPKFLAHVQKMSGKPISEVALTRFKEGDDVILAALERAGVRRIDPLGKGGRLKLSDPSVAVEFIPCGNASGVDGGAIYLPLQQTLFGGPAVINGPHIKLLGSNTSAWCGVLKNLQSLKLQHVVPGYGSWGGPQVLDREAEFLHELRQQVAHGIAMGQTPERIAAEVRLPDSYYVWMPYDLPTNDDIRQIYGELSAPQAPFGSQSPNRSDPQPHALVLIGDRVHEPEHLEKGLRPVFEATDVTPHFTVDYRALNAENLSRVSLLVVLRDGMIWPDGIDKPYKSWITPAQESAIVNFVVKGGAFLSLHNSMGLFPENGPYLNLVGGHYTGHGPLERFNVEVVDRQHPITRGVDDYFIADEQHTPAMVNNRGRVLLVSHSDDGTTAPAGWAYEPGKGRLVHLANGHTRDALNHPMFQRLMRNAVEWLLRRP